MTVVPLALVGNLLDDVFKQAKFKLIDEESHTDSGYDVSDVSPFKKYTQTPTVSYTQPR